MNRILKTRKIFCICAVAIFSIAAFGQQAPGAAVAPAMPAVGAPPAGIPAMGMPASQPATPQPETVSYENIFPEISPDKGKIGIGFFEKYWGWIAALCAAALVGLYLIFRPRKPVPKTPYELAVAAIDAAEQNSAELDEKEYASQISFAVRAYIEGQHSTRPRQNDAGIFKNCGEIHSIRQTAARFDIPNFKYVRHGKIRPRQIYIGRARGTFLLREEVFGVG